MTDKEILNEVYGKLKTAGEMPSTQDAFSIHNFIEQEWQKQDEKLVHIGADAKSLGQFSDSWYQESDPRRELEIGPDGTVTGVK